MRDRYESDGSPACLWGDGLPAADQRPVTCRGSRLSFGDVVVGGPIFLDSSVAHGGAPFLQSRTQKHRPLHCRSNEPPGIPKDGVGNSFTAQSGQPRLRKLRECATIALSYRKEAEVLCLPNGYDIGLSEFSAQQISRRSCQNVSRFAVKMT